MEDRFREMLAALHQAQQAVRDEMAPLQARDFDCPAALSLLQAVRSFATQAEFLLVMMAERGAEDALADAAEDLTGFFRDTEAWVEALLAAGQG